MLEAHDICSWVPTTADHAFSTLVILLGRGGSAIAPPALGGGRRASIVVALVKYILLNPSRIDRDVCLVASILVCCSAKVLLEVANIACRFKIDVLKSRFCLSASDRSVSK